MSRCRRPLATATLALATLATLVACGDDGAERRQAAADTADTAATAVAAVPGHLVPDSAAPPPSLLARACIVGDPEEGVPWTLAAASLPALPLVRLDSLAPRDSAQLAVRLARMVDVIPTDTTVADFRGLPVTVRFAVRAVRAETDTIYVAIVDRRLPMESSPLEERFTVIAAPGQRSGVRDALVEGWFVREAGAEQALVARDLGGVFATDSGFIVAFTEETASQLGAALIERREGRWRASWSGPLPSCPAR